MRRTSLFPRILSALFALGLALPSAYGAFKLNVLSDAELTISYHNGSIQQKLLWWAEWKKPGHEYSYYRYLFSDNTVGLTAPKRSGFDFVGWKTLDRNDTDGTFDLLESCAETQPIDENLTLSPSLNASAFKASRQMSANTDQQLVVSPTYNLISFSVDFLPNGGTGTMSPQGPFDINSSFFLTPNAFSKTGHAFVGWTNAVGAVFSDGALASGSNFWNESTWSFDEQLMAKWVLKTNTIAVATQGEGTGVVTGGGNYAYGTAVTLTATANDGSTFAGWTDGNKSSPRQVTMGETDATYTAIFDRIPTYTIAFYYKNELGNTVSDVRTNVFKGTTVEPPGQSVIDRWPHHRFIRWDSRKYEDVSASADIEALYEAISYAVTFDANGGAGLQMDPLVFESYETSQALTANTYTRTGYRFLGWSADKNAKAPTYSDRQTVSKLNNGVSFTLYAIWDPIAYSIEFSGGTGATGSMATTNVLYDQTVVLPKNAFVKPGCTFQMWKCADKSFADGATVSNLTTTADATVTLVATWDAPFWVDYKANGGKGLMSPQRFEKGIQQLLTSNRFTRVGYHFIGWNTNVAETALFTDGQVVSDADFPGTSDGTTNVLYAVWRSLTLSEAMMANTNLEWNTEKPSGSQAEVAWTVAGDDQTNTWAQQVGGKLQNQQFLVARIPQNGCLTFRWRATFEPVQSDQGLRFAVTTAPQTSPSTKVYLKSPAAGEWQTFSTNIVLASDEPYYFQFVYWYLNEAVGHCEIKEMTWTPSKRSPGEPVAITSTGISDGCFVLSIAGDNNVEYGIWTNADLTVNSWGLMEWKKRTLIDYTFTFPILPEQPQLFFKAHKVDWRCE